MESTVPQVGSLTPTTLLDEWLDARQSDRGLSANTETAYRSDLRVLAERIAGHGEQPALHRLTAGQLTTPRTARLGRPRSRWPSAGVTIAIEALCRVAIAAGLFPFPHNCAVSVGPITLAIWQRDSEVARSAASPLTFWSRHRTIPGCLSFAVASS